MFLCPGLPLQTGGYLGASELATNSRPRGLIGELVIELPARPYLPREAAPVWFTGRLLVDSGLAEL